jgi:hypothetical protein
MREEQMDTAIGALFQEVVIKAGAEAIILGLKSLRELAGGFRIAGSYDGAEDFWYRGIEADRLEDGARVRISGVLSPMAPFMPSHPRAKPGYSAAGWETVSQRLRTFLKQRRYPAPDDPLEGSGYDAMDLVVWGDAVVRPKEMARRKVYAGLYNIYGKSFECVPVFLDLSDSRQSKAMDELNWPKQPGAIVELTGSVRLMPSYYASIGIALPIETPELPCYCIEVSKINMRKPRKAVLYATAWCGARNGKVVTEFFDYMRQDEQTKGLSRLESRMKKAKITPWFYYDFFDCPLQRYPAGNQEVEARFRSI